MYSKFTLLMSMAIALLPHVFAGSDTRRANSPRPSRGTAATQPAEVRIPRKASVVIDGRLAPGEWDGSHEVTLSNGSRLWMRHDGEYLYLGMRLASPGFPSVCVTAGDTLRILHSSAALASAAYVHAGSSWQLRKPFAMAMRSGDTGATGKAAQRGYLAAERWLASTQAMSNTEREMQVALSLMDRKDLRLAVGVYSSSNDGAVAWPSTVTDGCTALKTVQGWLPNELVIDAGKWAHLLLAP